MIIRPHIIISDSEVVLPILNTETDAAIIAEFINRVMEDLE